MGVDLNKLDKFMKITEEIKHEDISAPAKKLTFTEAGAGKDIIDVLLKMKHGCFSSIKLALDNDEASDAIYSFRILSAQEEADIYDEMDKLKYQPGIHYQYDLYFISKVLSRASSKYLTDGHPGGKQPELTEEILRKVFPRYLLIALSLKYNDFKNRVSPRLETFTDEMLNDILADIQEAESDQKKLDIISFLSSRLMPEVILGLVNKLENLTSQLDKFVTGG